MSGKQNTISKGDALLVMAFVGGTRSLLIEGRSIAGQNTARLRQGRGKTREAFCKHRRPLGKKDRYHPADGLLPVTTPSACYQKRVFV